MDTAKSLAELSGTDWGPAPPAATFLMRERHEFRQTPISELTPSAFARLLDIGADYDILVPLALDRLTTEPDAIELLCAVLRADAYDWRLHAHHVYRVRDAVRAALHDNGQTTDDLERLSTEVTIYSVYSRFERSLSAIV